VRRQRLAAFSDFNLFIMSILEVLTPDLKATYRKRFFLIAAFFNLIPILYSIRPFLKNSIDSNDWSLSVFFMFLSSFGTSLIFGGNFWGVEGGFILHRFISSCSIKKITYSKIILSLGIFLTTSFVYGVLICYNLSKIPLNMVSFFIGFFVFILSLLPACLSYLSVKFCAPTYSNWLYPNRSTPSFVSGFQILFVVLFPLFVPPILFYALEQIECSALLIIFALSSVNFAFTKKLIDKTIEAFYKDRMEILNKII